MPDARPDDITEGYYFDPAISFVRAGERKDFRGGPARLDGFYIEPYCHPGCCRPWGPFQSIEEARQWSVDNLGPDVSSDKSQRNHGPTPRG